MWDGDGFFRYTQQLYATLKYCLVASTARWLPGSSSSDKCNPKLLKDSTSCNQMSLSPKFLTFSVRRKQKNLQPRPHGFSLKKWVGREKALASAGHVSPRTP